MDPILTYPVDAERVGAGVSAARTRDAEILFDSGMDPLDELFGPADLLGAAFAACLLENVERFPRLLPFYRPRRGRRDLTVAAEAGAGPRSAAWPGSSAGCSRLTSAQLKRFIGVLLWLIASKIALDLLT